MPFATRKRRQLKRTPPPPRQPVEHNQIEKPSFGSTMMQGMAFGTGSSIGHGIVEKVLHPNEKAPIQNDYCIKTKELYETCLSKNYSDCSELNELMSKFCK
jgi:hypothetical protein